MSLPILEDARQDVENTILFLQKTSVIGAQTEVEKEQRLKCLRTALMCYKKIAEEASDGDKWAKAYDLQQWLSGEINLAIEKGYALIAIATLENALQKVIRIKEAYNAVLHDKLQNAD